MKKTTLLVLLVAAIIIIWFAFGDAITLAKLQASLQDIRNYAQEHWFLFVLGFFLIYVTSTALSLPFASLLTLLGGAVFGFWQGLVIVSIASTTGATLAFLGARYFFRQSLEDRYPQRLKTINEGVKKEGNLFLFSLRLAPIIPFFLINLLMGLTKIRVRDYALVSWLGMLPGTAVYVYAGRNLGQISSASDIFTPSLVLSLTLLAIFPWIAKWIMAKIRERDIYKKYDKPEKFDRNLVVIGGGSAGLVSAYIAAASQAEVTMVEKNKTGGDCLNYGCVPSKALIKSGRIAAQMRHADHYGIAPQTPEFQMKDVSNRIETAIKTIEPHDSPERYRGLGVDVVLGEAEMLDPWRVQIKPHDDESYVLTTRSILLATGAKPFVPPIEGLADLSYLTSDNLWEAIASWKTLPKRILVLGGGNIGCELSQAFANLGAEVTLVEMEERLLAREDADVSEIIEVALRKSGVKVLTAHKAVSFSKGLCTAEHQGESVEIKFDEVLVAVGRAARTKGFGLEKLGIETDRAIKVDKYLRTNIPNILAAGDAIGPYQLTPTAAYEGTYGALNGLFGGLWKFKVDYRVVPHVTFTSPEVARVGMNEAEANEQKLDYQTTIYPISKLDRAITENEREGFVKILTKGGSDKILGVSIVSENAGDMIAEFTLAMKQGIGLRKILGTIHAYPTWMEAAKNASGQWSNANLNERTLKIPRWYLERLRK